MDSLALDVFLYPVVETLIGLQSYWNPQDTLCVKKRATQAIHDI
jgi:hypothetical protein